MNRVLTSFWQAGPREEPGLLTAQVCSAVCTPFFPAGTSLPLVVSLKLKIGGYLASGQWRKTLLKFELGVKGRHFIPLNLIFLGCKYRRNTMFYKVGVQCPDIELLRKMKWPDVQWGKEKTGSWLSVLSDKAAPQISFDDSPPSPHIWGILRFFLLTIILLRSIFLLIQQPFNYYVLPSLERFESGWAQSNFW